MNLGVLGLREVGLAVVVWAATTLVFQEWVVRFDLRLVQRLSGITVAGDEVERYRRRLAKVCWSLLVVGLVTFLGGVALHVAGY
jgi:hypothetical protein